MLVEERDDALAGVDGRWFVVAGVGELPSPGGPDPLDIAAPKSRTDALQCRRTGPAPALDNANADGEAGRYQLDLRLVVTLGGDVIPCATRAALRGCGNDLHELWNTIVEQPWTIDPGLGSWFVILEERAVVKRVRRELPALIGLLMAQNRDSLDVPRWPIQDAGVLSRPEEELLRQARRLRIARARRSEQPAGEQGQVWLIPPPSGGFVDDEGHAVPTWIVDFLNDPKRLDVRQRLKRSGADERHAFVIVSSNATAPIDVVLYLMSPDRVPPTSPPRLPPEISHVWIVDTFANIAPAGVRWSPDLGWQTFAKALDVG